MLEGRMAYAQKTHLAVKRELYDDFQKETKKINKKYLTFRGVAQTELNVKDIVIERMEGDLSKALTELKTLKTILHTPKLRGELKNYQWEDLDYRAFLKTVDALAYDVKN